MSKHRNTPIIPTILHKANRNPITKSIESHGLISLFPCSRRFTKLSIIIGHKNLWPEVLVYTPDVLVVCQEHRLNTASLSSPLSPLSILTNQHHSESQHHHMLPVAMASITLFQHPKEIAQICPLPHINTRSGTCHWPVICCSIALTKVSRQSSKSS